MHRVLKDLEKVRIRHSIEGPTLCTVGDVTEVRMDHLFNLSNGAALRLAKGGVVEALRM